MSGRQLRAWINPGAGEAPDKASPVRGRTTGVLSNRVGAPTVAPATRIGRKRGCRLCRGQSPTCVLRAGEDMVLRGGSYRSCILDAPWGERGGHRDSGDSGRGAGGKHSLTTPVPTVPVPHHRDKHGVGPGCYHWPNPGAVPGTHTGAWPSCSHWSSRDRPGQWPGAVGALPGLEPAPTTGPEACLAPGAVRPTMNERTRVWMSERVSGRSQSPPLRRPVACSQLFDFQNRGHMPAPVPSPQRQQATGCTGPQDPPPCP